MKFMILTLGCKVNAYESEYIKETFIQKGLKGANSMNDADVIVINTCSVTNQSDAKSRQIIRRARKNAPNSILVVVGCSAQNHKDEMFDYGANIVLGNKDKSKILDYVNDYIERKENIINMYDMSSVDFENMFLKSESDKTRAFVKIQDGCNNFCSYCIIPYMRGNIRSKNIDDAVNEINSLVDAGHREIVLTGIHTGSYGRGEDYDLTDLIRKISINPKLDRIRISSIEITELNDKFMDELKNNKKICNHLHIPLQSGSDVVLEKMNRKYDTNYYRDKIIEIRAIRPDISITTDLIVGFPYETEEEFDKTYDFIKEIGFTKIHTFPFSLRSGTKAEEMMNASVNDKDKTTRVHKILELSLELESAYYNKFVGCETEVLVETTKDGKSCGHTDNYISVNLDKYVESGAMCKVKIVNVDGLSVNGDVISID